MVSVRKESVDAVLRWAHLQVLLFFGLSPTPLDPDLPLLSSKGVRYNKNSIGRRTILPFWVDNATAERITGLQWEDGDVLLFICAAEPTTGARCLSEDFFVCVPETPECKKVVIWLMFSRSSGGSLLLSEPKYMLEVIQRLADKQKLSRENAKARRLSQFA